MLIIYNASALIHFYINEDKDFRLYLRDGGYYTNWDFSSDVVKTYIETTNKLPVDYLEVGYRNKPTKEYMGKFGYTPVSILKKLRKSSNKKLAVMLNEKAHYQKIWMSFLLYQGIG